MNMQLFSDFRLPHSMCYSLTLSSYRALMHLVKWQHLFLKICSRSFLKIFVKQDPMSWYTVEQNAETHTDEAKTSCCEYSLRYLSNKSRNNKQKMKRCRTEQRLWVRTWRWSLRKLLYWTSVWALYFIHHVKWEIKTVAHLTEQLLWILYEVLLDFGSTLRQVNHIYELSQMEEREDIWAQSHQT